MQSIVVAFFAGVLAAGLAALAYIRVLHAKVRSYEVYVTRRIDAQIANLLPSHALSRSKPGTGDTRDRLVEMLSTLATQALNSRVAEASLGSTPRS